MTEVKKNLPKWILIISGIFAILELMVSIQLCFSPQSVMENADLKAEGVKYLIYMWAALLVMFIGDLLIGISQKENTLTIAAVVMIIVSSAMIFAINKRK